MQYHREEMGKSTAFAPGKIILTGEYAVVFGHPGIAVPAPLGMKIHYEENLGSPNLAIEWKGIRGGEEWMEYLQDVIERYQDHPTMFLGTLTIENDLPLGKGMGSSTSLVIAVARCLLGEHCKEKALEIEDAVNPGHSGIDFAVVWNAQPVFFQKGHPPELFTLPTDLLKGALLIDTGSPNETTPELVSWIEEQQDKLQSALKTIGKCTKQLKEGGDLRNIIRDHHRAQVSLDVVPLNVQDLIEAIENAGGSAKIIGAGGRTGGGGMVLAVHDDRETLQDAIPDEFPTFDL